MRKLVPLLLIALVPVLLLAAAPAYNNWANWMDTLTVDSQYTSAWELIDSIIVVKTDTCYTLYTMQGIARLSPDDKLYLGFIDGGGAPSATSTATDTFVVQLKKVRQYGTIDVPFCVTYLDSLISQSDANDTIYFMAAVGGSAQTEKVVIENLLLKAEVLDFNAGGVIGE